MARAFSLDREPTMPKGTQKSGRARLRASPNPLRLVLATQQAGRLDEADAGYQRLLAARPSDADAWHLWGVLAAEQKRFDLALERIRRALELRPREPIFLGNLGNVYAQRQELGQAIDCYAQAARLESAD